MTHDRRTFLRTVGAGCAGVLVAGCSGTSDGDDGTETDGETETEADTETEDGSDGDDGTETEEQTEEEDEGPDAEPTENTIITIEAGGADIWNQVDKGHFFYEEVSGDFDVRVQVTSLENTNPHAKAGLMVRESLDAGSKNVMIRRRPGFGTSPQWRPRDDAETTSTTSEDGAPLSNVEGGILEDHPWQRLERTGSTIRTYASQDGEDWTLMAELPANIVQFSDEVVLGLAATSHERTQLTTAKFRNLSGLSPDQEHGIGNPIESGSVSISESLIVSPLEPDASADGATLRADLEALGGAEEVEAHFEYREVTEDEWSETDAQTLTEAGEFSTEVSGLTGRRYYNYRVVATDGEEEVSTVSELFSTPSASGGDAGDGPESAAYHDMADGFADVAPWLDDDTPIVTVSEPTFEALNRAVSIDGPRVIAFETSGTIDLEADRLAIRNDKCWIAGQTAPSPGITLVRGDIWVYGNDCVIQHIRIRPGDAGQDTGWQPDGIETADETTGNVIDHCTGTWSVDENINIGYDTENSTISNCLMAEPLNDATHAKGEHGYNSIIGDRAKNVALMGNVYGLGTDRNPRLKQGTETVVVNNLIHHYHDGMWADPDTAHSIVGNAFEDPQQPDQPNIVMKDGSGADLYADGNVQLDDANVPMVDDAFNRVNTRPLWPDGMDAMDAADVKETNLENAGARPADRTEHDVRIVENIRNGEGGVIDSQEEVGGYPELPENQESIDEPETGLRAWLREQALAVEN